MATVINTYRRTGVRDVITARLESLLPYRLADEIRTVGQSRGQIEEIRCRRGRRTYLTTDRGNVALSYVVGDTDMDSMVDNICGGSLYAHKTTILEGFVTLEGGIRVGICGRAAVENNRIIGIYDISGLNIRLPHPTLSIGEPICKLLREGQGGVLIYSPPGVGKTTLLRSVCAKMSSGDLPLRVCVIDTRGEIALALEGGRYCLDVLVGYPREVGIEIATRTMSAQLIICDEIGGMQEAEAMLSAQNCGVPFVATAHGDSVRSLMKRTGIRRLHESGVFEYYVGITRAPYVTDFVYDIKTREAADAYF